MKPASCYADPFNRGTYPWGREDTGLRECIRQMAALRNGNSALSAGELEPLVCAAGMAAWRRRDETGEFIICVNPGEGPLPLPMPPSTAKRYSPSGRQGERRAGGPVGSHPPDTIKGAKHAEKRKKNQDHPMGSGGPGRGGLRLWLVLPHGGTTDCTAE